MQGGIPTTFNWDLGGQNGPHPVSLNISETNADNDTKPVILLWATILHIVSKNKLSRS